MNKELTRAALLLTVALVIQALRVILPLPGLVTMFIIGSVVNMCLVLTVWLSKVQYALLSCAILPLLAYLQGQLAFLPMWPVVFAGNAILVLVAAKRQDWRLWVFGPVLKTVVLWAGTGLVLQLLQLNGILAKLMLTMMSWPQLVTALTGIGLAKLAARRTGLHR
jgi:hypothetical protein